MTVEELRGQMLVERYATTIRSAEAMLAWATPWTPSQQRRHRRDAEAEVADYEARLRDAPRPYPPPGRVLREAIVHNLPPRGEVA